MTPDQKQQINIAIAEAMGWAQCKSEYPCGAWHNYGGNGEVLNEPSNYTDSLDACAEFRKTLTGAECLEYVRILNEVTKHMAHITAFPMIDATSEQHSETFCRLRKIGPWRET